MTKVSVLVSLDANGNLQLELPGPAGGLRAVPLRDTATSPAVDTIKRVLQGLASQANAIGQDGSPTTQQVRHWQRHSIWPDSRCAFCQAEGQARAIRATLGAPITKVPKGHRAPGQVKTAKTAEELGL